MSLAPSEQRALTEIENSLKRSDPTLAELLADFNRIASPEELPRWERLSPWRSRLKDILPVAVATFLLSLLVLCFAVLGNVSRPSRAASCGFTQQVTACQQAQSRQSQQGHAQQAHRSAGGSAAAGTAAAS